MSDNRKLTECRRTIPPQVLQTPPETVEVLADERRRCNMRFHCITKYTKRIRAVIWITNTCDIARLEPRLSIRMVDHAAVKEVRIARLILKTAGMSPACFLSLN